MASRHNNYLGGRPAARRISALGILTILLLGTAIGLIGLNLKRWEATAPEVTFDRDRRIRTLCSWTRA
jgi:hypothetical protein